MTTKLHKKEFVRRVRWAQQFADMENPPLEDGVAWKTARQQKPGDGRKCGDRERSPEHPVMALSRADRNTARNEGTDFFAPAASPDSNESASSYCPPSEARRS